MAGSGSLLLKLRDPDGQEREVSFTQDVITIGRSHECDLPLESGFISRNHARMSYVNGGWQIVDEGSKNGVFVNGQRIAGSTAVKAGDALRIGDYRVAVLADAAEAVAPEADADRTLVINPAMLDDLDLSRRSPAGAASGSAMPGSPLTRPDQPSEQRPQEQTPSERAPVAASPVKPAFGVAATEPVPTPAPADEVAAAQARGAAGQEAVSAVSKAPEGEIAPPPNGKRMPGESQEQAPTGAATGLVVDAAKRSVLLDGHDQSGQLTSREIDVLIALAASGASGSGIDELATLVWGSGGGDAEMLERLLYRLRGKLNADVIERLPGGGIRLSKWYSRMI
jgi:pSer/pThr/pTyr-binding forkhead associated (FHA) protein